MYKLVIQWTCVGVFVMTAVITLLAITNIIKLADKKYRDRLFGLLIVEVVAACVGFFVSGFQSTEEVKQECEQVGEVRVRRKLEPRIETLTTEKKLAETRAELLKQKTENQLKALLAVRDRIRTLPKATREKFAPDFEKHRLVIPGGRDAIRRPN